MIDIKVIRSLEFDKILSRVKEFAHGFDAKKKLDDVLYSLSFASSSRMLQETEQADKVLYKHLKSPMSDYDDITETLKKVSVGEIIEIPALVAVKKFLRASRICKTAVEEIENEQLESLMMYINMLHIDKRLEEEIENAVLSDEELSDNASSELRNIRRNIFKCNNEIKEILLDLTHSEANKKYLQDSIVTMRSGRYVVPVKAEYRQNIVGLVHDRSNTNSTFFIEPMQVVELNNKLRGLELDEKAEVERILKEFGKRIASYSQSFFIGYENITMLDAIFAKASYSKSIKAEYVKIYNDGIVDIRRGRHPLISADKVVPIDISIGVDFDALIVTGSNTGGKTVSLKTVGLFSLMAMSGLFLPALGTGRISYFENIFCDIGDEQSIENSLSTFSSHMLNIKRVCENVDKQSLVLLDEIGAGTDPEEGAALAIAIVDFIIKKGAKLITTTHYDKLKAHFKASDRAETAAMEFDSNTLTPTYKLRIGASSGSRALEIASLLGFNPEVVAKAKTFLSPEKIQAQLLLSEADKVITQNNLLLKQTEKMAAELEEKLSVINKKNEELTERLEKAKTSAINEARRKISAEIDDAEDCLRHIREISMQQNIGTVDIVKAGELKNELERTMIKLSSMNTNREVTKRVTHPFVPHQAKVGDRVFVKSLSAEGNIENIKSTRNEFFVKVGNMSLSLKAGDLLKMDKEHNRTQETIVVKHSGIKSVSPEINILGQTGYDAEIILSTFLDSALAAGLTEVKIIHGMGTGRLRTAVHAFLKKHSNVKEFRLGTYGEGDRGVTIVTLK